MKKYIPTIGILLFYMLYFISSFYYSGGSNADINATGFDWVSNYTCDLFHTHGINGLPNPARPIGLVGVVIICTSLSVFFYQFSQVIPMSSLWAKIIQIAGGLCMICAVLLFTDLHHTMVLLASILGLLAIIGAVRGLLKNKYKKQVFLGAVCMFLLILNNYFYSTDTITNILPLIQKITIVLILSWVMSLNFELIKAETSN